jgi:hypothetical protein
MIKVKYKVVPVTKHNNTMKAYRVHEGESEHILKYLQLNKRLAGSQSQSGHGDKQKNPCDICI